MCFTFSLIGEWDTWKEKPWGRFIDPTEPLPAMSVKCVGEATAVHENVLGGTRLEVCQFLFDSCWETREGRLLGNISSAEMKRVPH